MADNNNNNNESAGKMYTQEQIDSIFSDFKTLVLPQIRTAIEGRVKKVNGKGLSTEDFTTALKSALETLNTTTVPGIDTRLQAVEALMGEASQGDNDQVINKVREMISFFANIAESDTLAGLLASLKTEIEAEIPTVPTVKADGVTGPTINRFCECSTAANQAAKTASMTAGTLTLEKGARVTVKFANENTADSPTLNIGGTGAKAIYIGGEQVTDGDEKELLKGTCDFVYNGTAWDMVAGAGGGGAGAVQGKIIVSLTALVNGVQGAASLLNGATVTLRNTTKDVQVGETQTWAGQQIVFRGLTPVENYRVIITNPNSALWAVSSLQQDVTALGIGAEETVTFELSQDQYTMAVNIGGGRVVIGQTEYANGDTYGVAAGTSITATAKAVTNYVTPTPSISGKTITATYVAYGYVTVNTASNQGQDATIAAVTPTIKIGSAAAVSYTAPVQVAPDTQVIVTWPAVTGYATPAQQTFTKSGTSDETKTGTYQTEVLTVSITKDTGDGNLATVSIAVTDGNTSLGTLTQASPTLKIPYGVNYTLTPSALDGYATPAAVTKDWADTTAKSVTFQYEEVTMLTGYIVLDQTSSDPTTKVIDEGGHTYSNYQRPAVIDAIRAASHCYVGTFANNKMTLKQLDDSDGTKYADGTSAATDIASTGKDVFMRLPFFFTRVSTYATDKIKIEFAFDPNQTVSTTAQPDGSGWKQWGGNDLIGKYEAYEASNKTYSVSGKTPTGNVSQADFKSHARARGTGFTIVKWRHQNLMAILFYAYYGHTNCQSLIGSGASSNEKQTGLKDSFGMTDTTAANGNTNNIVFWGLENWWGNKYEWVDNVVIDNHTWTITEDDGSTRTIQSSAMASGNSAWIYSSKFILGDNLDVIAAAGQSGGSDSTGYCDGQYYTSDSSRVVQRSCSYANAYGGVACVGASNDSSSTNTNVGSRLAFSGTIEIS